MRILKQVLDITDRKTYQLPGDDIKILSIKEQDGNLVMYFETDATADEIIDRKPLTDVTVCVAGTGHERFDLEEMDYVDTVMSSYGLVWHCYVLY